VHLVRRGLWALLGGVASLALSLPAAAETLLTSQIPEGVYADATAYELGMKFQSAAGGSITAIRYYKAESETTAPGSHVGKIWDANGNLLTSVTFTGESSAAGWQQASLFTPLPIQANTTYVVSVNVVTHYVASRYGLLDQITNGNLRSVVGDNGVFTTAAGSFPTSSFYSTNYFVDVDFQAQLPAQACVVGEKYVSVNGPAGPFVRNSVTSNNPVAGQSNPLVANILGTNNTPDASVNIPTATYGGQPVFYRFVITNCGTVDLYNVRVDDCADQRSVGSSGFLQGGANGQCVENPRLIPANPQRIVAPKLTPGQTIAVTSASFPLDPISTIDMCGTFGRTRLNGIIRNDSQVEADADLDRSGSGETFVYFDDLNLVRCAEPPTARIKLLKQVSVDNGTTWREADAATSADTPTVQAPSDAQYRFIVTNTGNVGLSNVVVSDPTLGLTNVPVPGSSLAAGQSVTITAGTSSAFSGLYVTSRCNSNSLGNLTNVASVTGTPPNGAPNVTDSNPAVLICQPPPPQECVATTTIGSNFNGTAIPAGYYVWFNSNLSAKGMKDGTSITFSNQKISFTSNGTPYNLSVPNGVIRFSASATCATTSFNATLNRWETTVPLAGSDEIFISGLAFPVPASFQKGINPVNWTGTMSTSTPGVQISWKWAAAAYSQFSPDYNQLGVKPTHTAACSYANSDHAGTPELWKKNVVGGARGGGGSNFTGSWSGTASVKPTCP
jgi:uncharacterized repeat protein (TIGR01451 family)